MQNYLSKIIILFLIGLFGLTQEAYTQPANGRLQVADSLFSKHQYTQSFDYYQQILHQDQFYSPQMLLKMAFIQEGLRNYTQALYFLHLYHAKYPSRAALRKIEELARAHKLSGYVYSDLDFFETQFHKHYLKLLELMLMAAVIALTVMAINKRKNKPIPGLFKVVFGVYMLFIFYFLNFLDFGKEGIIRQNQVPVMSAPSAGSQWISTTGAGHKVSITSEQDIWYQVKWNGQKAFIRKNNILPLP